MLSALFASACSAAPFNEAVHRTSSDSAKVTHRTKCTPHKSDVIDVVGSNYKLNKLNSNFQPGEVVVFRVLRGFQAAENSLITPKGNVVTWGMRYGDASEQSFAICDQSGHVVAIAITNGYGGVVGRGKHPSDTFHKTINKYKTWGVVPVGLVFFKSRKSMSEYFSLFRYWLAANLLGMNTDCDEMKQSCQFAKTVQLNVHTFVNNSSSKTPESVALPKRQLIDIPLDDFKQ